MKNMRGRIASFCAIALGCALLGTVIAWRSVKLDREALETENVALRQEREETRELLAAAGARRKRLEREALLAERTAYCHAMIRARMLADRGMYVEPRAILAALPERSRSWDFRHLAGRIGLNTCPLKWIYPHKWPADRPPNWPEGLPGCGGHLRYFQDIDFSPDGSLLAGGTGRTTIRLVRTATGKEVRILYGHRDLVDSVRFTAGGTRLASTSYDGNAKTWNLADGKVLSSAKRKDSVLGWTDGKTPAAKWTAKSLRIYDERCVGGQLRLSPTAKRRSLAVHAMGPKGNVLALAYLDKSIKLWRMTAPATEPQLLATLRGHTDFVLSLVISPDGKRLASGGRDGTVRLWAVPGGKPLKVLRPRAGHVTLVRFDRSGRRLASCHGEKYIYLWETLSGRRLSTLEGVQREYEILFSPDDRWMATAGERLRLWDTAPRSDRALLKEHRGAVRSLRFSPDGKTLASGSWDDTVRLWSVAGKKSRAMLGGHSEDLASVAFSPDGRSLASLDKSGRLCRWETATGRELPGARVSGSHAAGVAFLPGGKSIALGTRTGVEIRGASDGKLLRALKARKGFTTALAVAPRNAVVAAGSNDGAIRLWNGTTGKVLGELRGHTGTVRSLAMSPDERLLASASRDGSVRLWDLTGRRQLRKLSAGKGAVRCVAFSPDGRRLAAGGADHRVRIWDALTGMLILELEGHEERVLSLAFSPDGKLLASGDEQGIIILWESTDPPEEKNAK